MNHAVDAEHRDPSVVARDFLARRLAEAAFNRG
jgi:glycine betaine/choline ABC-type transport system substrate-binding protein